MPGSGFFKLLSRKLFTNVNSLFAIESEVVILGRHLGVPAASLRKFTLAYCTQDQPR